MLILKHLKTLQHVLIFIQIIFREFIRSLLKSLNLKDFLKGQLWWCGSITFGVCAWRSVWECMLDNMLHKGVKSTYW